MRDLIILIPSFNEKKSLKKILKILDKKIDVLIVDDCSTDNTKIDPNIKKNKIIINKKRLGYEKSLIAGFNFIKKNLKKKYIITFDADGEHPVNSIKKMYEKIKLNNLDLLIAERDKKNRLSEILLSFIFNKKFAINDPLSGLKIYKSYTLYKILKNIKNDQFLVDAIYEFINKKTLIKNIKIKVNTIKSRKSRVGNLFYSNYKIYKIILKTLLK
jgi:glycosyltransferase involved in cell wall biosynthesis